MSEPKRRIEGIKRHQEVHIEDKIQDTRSFGVKFYESISTSPVFFYSILIAMFVSGLLLPFTMDFMFIFSVIVSLITISVGSNKKLLFDIPISSGKRVMEKGQAVYYNEFGEVCEGTYFLGNDLDYNNEEIWFSDSFMRTHILIFGTTGAGKSEALLSICFNALLTASGFIYTDGKGTAELYFKVYNTCRMVANEDNLRLISFLTGDEDLNFATYHKYSNTLNPFSDGSVDALSNLLVSLMSEGSGDGMWKDRASVLMEAVLGLLVYQRDYQKRLIYVDTIRETLILNNIYKAWNDAKGISDPNEPGYLPNHVLKSLHGYLVSLPGFEEDKPFEEQNQTIHEQHGYLFMQFTKLLGSLADMYGYIFNTQLSEVNFWDVVTKRRVLVVLLPSLAKSQNELSMLGKIIVACIKQMASSGLGKHSEGVIKNVLWNNPTTSKSAFIIILDEFGYYAVKGTAVIPAQARGLGFSMIFAGQDYQAFKQMSAEEAASIKANCVIHICMKLKDEADTYKLFEAQAEQAEVAVLTGKTYKDGNILRNNETVSYEKRNRITFRDLNQQKSGEAHIFSSGKMARIRFLYAKIKLSGENEIKINQFLKVAPPEQETAEEINRSFEEIKEKISNIKYMENIIDEIDDENQEQVIEKISTLYNQYNRETGSPQKASCATIAHILLEKKDIIDNEKKKRNIITENNYQTAWVKNDTDYDEEVKEYEENKKDVNKEKSLAKVYGEKFSDFEGKIKKRQMMLNENIQSVENETSRIINSVNNVTAYPKDFPEPKKPREMSDLIDNLTKQLQNYDPDTPI